MTATQDALKVRLFGPPTVSWAGRPLVIPRRQVRALLYRLSADQKPIPRERLCFLFWADTPETVARRKLSGLLSHLQNALPVPDLLITEDDRAWLNPALTWSDTVAFDRLRTQAGTLEQAVDLYDGPFLDAFSLCGSPEFEMWASLERQARERDYLEALATLIEEHASQGNHHAAIVCAQRYLEADEVAEGIHRHLMELYAATGDRSSALRQFERCTAILERELGVSPLPETQMVYQNIRGDQPLPATQPDSEARWAVLPSANVSLVGRDTVLQQLQQAYDRARAGHGSTVLISGEAGIGKSRLMQAVASRLQGEVLVLVGTAYSDTQTTPYQPIVDALRPALVAGYSWLSVRHCCLAEASHLLPELQTLYPDLRATLPSQDDYTRSRLFEALCNLTLALAAGPHPLLLCLDDLHWADPTTLNWLAYLGRRIGNARLLIVATYRTEDINTLAELRLNLSRSGHLTELALHGLDESAILQIIRNLHGGRAVSGDGAAATRLATVTGGNPFFLLETLQALTESGLNMKALSRLESLPLPDTIMDVVDARLRRLSPTARQILEAGAILGQTFAFEPVHRTAGRGEMEAIDGLDELVMRRLLTENGAEYRFHHELIQMAVYQGLSYWRRRVLHHRAAETLENLQPGNAAALARHFAEAEEPGRAARYALQAGRAAKTVFAHLEARRHFDQALALLQHEATELQDPHAVTANQALQVEALQERGWALRLIGDMEAYVHDLEQVAHLAESLGDPRTLAHLRWREAYTHRWFCRYPQARQAAEEGLRLSQQVGDRLLEALCGREMGMAARESGDYAHAQASLERSLALFTELGEIVYRIHTLGNLATLQWYLGDYASSRDLARQALSICDQADLPLHRRLPLGDLGAAAAALGDAELASRCLQESLALARETADRTQEILCLLHLGWLCIRQKQPAEALPHLQAGLELARQVSSCTEQGWLLSGLAEAHRLAGRHDQAQALALQALNKASATGRPYDESLARRILNRLEHAHPEDGMAAKPASDSGGSGNADPQPPWPVIYTRT